MSQLRRRDEVGVEDGDELALGGLEAFFEGAGLVAVAVGAVEVVDGLRGEAVGAGGVAGDDGAGDFDGLVGGVVEELDLEAVAGVVEAAAGVDEAVDDELLVVDGELDGDEGELVFGEVRGRLGRTWLRCAVAVVEPDELVAMDAVERQDDHHDEVRDEQARRRRRSSDRRCGRCGRRSASSSSAPDRLRGEEHGERVELAEQGSLRLRRCEA